MGEEGGILEVFVDLASQDQSHHRCHHGLAILSLVDGYRPQQLQIWIASPKSDILGTIFLISAQARIRLLLLF
jgi:hypothetical protein